MSEIVELDNLLDALNERRITPAQGPAAGKEQHTKDLTLSEVFLAALHQGTRKAKNAPLETPWPALDTLMRTIANLGGRS